eukprot:3310972-Alexandrium_andersonii.AAC.1
MCIRDRPRADHRRRRRPAACPPVPGREAVLLRGPDPAASPLCQATLGLDHVAPRCAPAPCGDGTCA